MRPVLVLLLLLLRDDRVVLVGKRASSVTQSFSAVVRRSASVSGSGIRLRLGRFLLNFFRDWGCRSSLPGVALHVCTRSRKRSCKH